MRFNLHAIYFLARRHFPGEDEFTLPLPIDIAEGVRLEDVSALVPAGSFDIIRQRSGTDVVDTLQGIRHALIHRFDPRIIFDRQNRELITEAMQDGNSRELINLLAYVCDDSTNPRRHYDDARKCARGSYAGCDGVRSSDRPSKCSS